MSFSKQWIKPEVYPLFVYIGGILGLAGFVVARNLVINPEVRVNKEDRQSGLLQNYKEGEAYRDHAVRKYLHGKKTEIMPAFNEYFSKPSSSK